MCLTVCLLLSKHRYNITFKTTKIVQSPKMKNCYQHELFFDENLKMNVDKLANMSTSFNNLSGIARYVREFDYLKLEECVFMMAVEYLPNIRIRHLRVCTSLDIAEKLCKRFESIKVLDLVLVGMGPHDVANDLQRLDKFIITKRDDLTVYVWGMEVTRDNLDRFMNCYAPLAGQTTFIFRRPNLIINQCGVVNHLNEYDDILKRFYELVEIITFEKHLHAVDELEKLTKIRDMYLNLVLESGDNFVEFLKYFPLLNRLEITQKATTRLSNAFFNPIPVYCKYIYYLKLYCFDPLNFNFLFKMANLKYLILTLYYPIKNTIFIKFLKTLKYLSFFQVQFQPTENYDKAELSRLLFLDLDVNYKFLFFNQFYLEHRHIQANCQFVH